MFPTSHPRDPIKRTCRPRLSRRRPSIRRPPAYRPELEPVEDRCLLSAGAPDPTFGSNGVVTTAFPNNTNDWALSVAIYPNAGTSNDGKIVAAGYSSSPTNTLLQNFALARYNPDGRPDPSFDGDGKVVTDVSGIGEEDAAFAVAIQADGKIVAAGWARRRSGDTDFAVVRYNVNGGLDPTFGTKGIVFTDFNRGDDHAFSMLIQPDGKILVAGLGGGGLCMARYNANGSLDDGSKKDTTPGDHFGNGGKVVFSFSSVPGSTGDGGTPSTVGLAPDGKILLSGTALTGPTTQILVLLRYNADGTLDRSFGSAGMVVDTSMPSGLLSVRSDGELVVEGVGLSNDWLFARYQANGSPDTSFGTNGYAEITPPPDASPGNFALQSDGKIVAPGVVPGGMLALRLNVDGSVDTTFGSNGFSITSVNGNAGAVDAAIQSDGNIVLAGSAVMPISPPPGTSNDFALVRLLGSDNAVMATSAASLGEVKMAVLAPGEAPALWPLAPASIPGLQGPLLLAPLTPTMDQDLTALATELILTGRKRPRHSLWG